MRIEASRRDVLLGMGAASLGGLTAGLAGSRPARAGVGWGPGPNSGLPFWLGGHGDYDAMVGLMPAGRSVDMACLWETSGHYLEVAARDPGPWGRSLASTYLTRLKVGPRLVDASALPQLYSGRVRPRHLYVVMLGGLAAMAAALSVTPVGHVWAGDLATALSDVVGSLLVQL